MPRMQAIISYPRLTDDTRNKSWETFFNKLIEDMKSDMKKGGRKRRIKVSRSAKEYLFSDEEAKAVKWNGREIRIAFQTTLAFAEYDALHESDREESDPINVELSHFQDVVKLSVKFRKWMERLVDDAKRPLKRTRGMTTRYPHLVRRRSCDRDERKKGIGGTFCWFMDTSPQIPIQSMSLSFS